LINWLIYKDIEVTNYSELISKAKYGQITHSDLRAGSFDLIEDSLCLMIKDELTKECISDFQKTKDICANKIFDNKNLKGFSQDQTDNLIRLFNFCRQS
jgi:CRISPR/Cas system-associated endonuclease Cas3-HD